MPRVKVKIQKSPKANKDWQATYKNPKTGRTNTISGGDGKSNERGKSKRGAKAFASRHGTSSPKQQINSKIWKGTAKIGSTVTINI